MSKYFVRYEKVGNAQYISQLDFLRTIGRALRRAEIPVKYSEGFNPHLLISFASPLSVGITSSCEIFSAELTSEIGCEKILSELNGALPPIIHISSVTKEPIDFNSIASADYSVFPENMPTDELLDIFLKNDTVLMDKKTKKGIKETNIRENIIRISLDSDKLMMTLSAGNAANLNPMLAADAISKYSGTDLGFCRFHRVAFRNAKGEVI